MRDIGGLDNGIEDKRGASFALAPWGLVSSVMNCWFEKLTVAVAAVDDERFCLHAVPDMFAGTATFHRESAVSGHLAEVTDFR